MGNEENSLNRRPTVYKYLERNRDTLMLIAIFGAFSGFVVSLYLHPDYQDVMLLYALVSAFLIVLILTGIAFFDGLAMIFTDDQSLEDIINKTAVAAVIIFLYFTVVCIGWFLIANFPQEFYDSLAGVFLIIVFFGSGLVSLITNKIIITVGKGITGIAVSAVLFVVLIFVPKYILIPMGTALLLWVLALSIIIWAMLNIGFKTVKIWRT